MSKENRAAKNSAGKSNTKKNSLAWLPNTLYVISALLAVVFVYMMIVNIMYIKNYLASYGMAFSDMWMDSIQYILTGSISYLVYAILVFCAGKLISMVGAEQAGASQDMVLSKNAEAAGGAKQQAADAGVSQVFGETETGIDETAEADGEKVQNCEPQDEAGTQIDIGAQTEDDGLHSDEDEAAKADLQAETAAAEAGLWEEADEPAGESSQADVDASLSAEEASQADADASPAADEASSANTDESSAEDEPQEKTDSQADTNA